MPPQVQTKSNPNIREIPPPEVGNLVLNQFATVAHESLNDAHIKKLLTQGSASERDRALKSHLEFLQFEFDTASKLLANYPRETRNGYQRQLSKVYYASKAGFAGLAGSPETEQDALLNVISGLIGKESLSTSNVDFYSLKFGTGNKVNISERTSDFSNLWGLNSRKVSSLSFDDFIQIAESYSKLNLQDKEILFKSTLKVGLLNLNSKSPDNAYQISQLLNLFLGEDAKHPSANISFDRKTAVLGFDSQLYQKLSLPKEALINAEALWKLSLSNFQREKTPGSLISALNGANVLAEAKLYNPEDKHSAPAQIRNLRQKIEAEASGMLYKDNKLKSDYREVAPLKRGLLVALQKIEVDAYRQASNSIEANKTLENLTRHYLEESKELVKVYQSERNATPPPVSARIGAGSKNFVSEFGEVDLKSAAVATILGCGTGVKFGAAGSWVGAAAGCALGAGIGLSALSLMQVIRNHERIMDGFTTGYSPHEDSLILALDCVNLITTIVPPLKAGSRILRPAIQTALKNEVVLTESLLSKLGTKLPATHATDFSVEAWNKIYKVFPKDLPSDLAVYQLSKEHLEGLLNNKIFQKQLSTTLDGPGNKFLKKLITVSESGRDALSKQELEGILKRATIDYVGDAGPTILGLGLSGTIGSLTNTIIQVQQSGGATGGNPQLLEAAKQLTMMLAFSIALHKTQQGIVSHATGQLRTLDLPKPEMVAERTFMQSAAKNGIDSTTASSLFNLFKKDFVPLDPVLTDFNTGKFRVNTLERAQKFQVATGKSIFYLEFDIGGLGALNEFFADKGRNHSGANTHFKAISEIVNKKVAEISNPVPFRHGGDEFSHVVTLKEGVGKKGLVKALEEISQEVDAYVKKNGLENIPPTKENRPAGLGIYYGMAPIRSDVSIRGLFNSADNRFFVGSGSKWSLPSEISHILSLSDQGVESQKKNSKKPIVAPVKIKERRAPIPDLPLQLGEVSHDPAREHFVTPDQILRENFIKAGKELNSSLTEAQLSALAPKYDIHAPSGFIANTTGQLLETIKRAQKFAEQTNQPAFYFEGSLRGLPGLNSLLGHSNTNKIFKEIADSLKVEILKLGGDVSFFHKGGSDFGLILTNVSREQIQSVIPVISDKVKSLCTENDMLRQALSAKGLKDIPATKATDIPGLFFDGAIAPLHPSISTDDVFHYVEGVIRETGGNRRKALTNK